MRRDEFIGGVLGLLAVCILEVFRLRERERERQKNVGSIGGVVFHGFRFGALES